MLLPFGPSGLGTRLRRRPDVGLGYLTALDLPVTRDSSGDNGVALFLQRLGQLDGLSCHVLTGSECIMLEPSHSVWESVKMVKLFPCSRRETK